MNNPNKPIFLGFLPFFGLLTFALVNYFNKNNSDLIIIFSCLFLLVSVIVSAYGIFLSYKTFKKGHKIKGVIAMILNLMVPILILLLVMTAIIDIIKQASL